MQLGDNASAVAWPRSRVAVAKARAIVRAYAGGPGHHRLNVLPRQIAVPEPRIHHDRRLARTFAQEMEAEAAHVNEFTGRWKPPQVARRVGPLIDRPRNQERGDGGEDPTEESGPAAGILGDQLNLWTAKATATRARTVTTLPRVPIRAPAAASPA